MKKPREVPANSCARRLRHLSIRLIRLGYLCSAWLLPRTAQRLEARDHIEKFLVDATLPQSVECAVEILQQFIDVSFRAFHCRQAARVLTG